MIGEQVITEAKGGFSKSYIEEMAPVLSDLGNRIFAKVKKYTHSPMRWVTDYNERSGFSSVEFETTDLSDIEVKGNMIIDWTGRGDAFVHAWADTTGGVRGPTHGEVKVYTKDPLDNLVNMLVGMCRDANLTSER